MVFIVFANKVSIRFLMFSLLHEKIDSLAEQDEAGSSRLKVSKRIRGEIIS